MYLPVTFVFVCLILYFTKSPQFLLSVMQWFINDHPLIIYYIDQSVFLINTHQ